MDIMYESHVEHTIGFIENEVSHCIETEKPLLHQIDQPARSGDDDIRTCAERDLLAPLAYATVDEGVAQRQISAVYGHTLGDLRRQLAGRRENQRAGATAGRPLRSEALQDRQHERSGLARAGLSARENVAACEHERYDLRLNRRRLRVALVEDCGHQRNSEAKCGKWRS